MSRVCDPRRGNQERTSSNAPEVLSNFDAERPSYLFGSSCGGSNDSTYAVGGGGVIAPDTTFGCLSIHN